MRTGLVFLSTATSWTLVTTRAVPAEGRFHISPGHLDIQPGQTLSFPSKAYSYGPGKDTFTKPNTFTFFSPFYFDSCLSLGLFLFSYYLLKEVLTEVLEMVERISCLPVKQSDKNSSVLSLGLLCMLFSFFLSCRQALLSLLVSRRMPASLCFLSDPCELCWSMLPWG